jgi:hypothetical protein
MIVREPTKLKRKLVTVKYYVTKEESAEFKKVAFLLFQHKAIPRPTIGEFAKAAGYKLYNDINQVALNEARAKRN